MDKIKKEDTFLMKEIATCIDMHLGSAYGADEAWCVDIEKNLQVLLYNFLLLYSRGGHFNFLYILVVY